MDTTSQTTPQDSKENSQEQSSELLKNEGGLLEGGMLAKEIGGDGNVQNESNEYFDWDRYKEAVKANGLAHFIFENGKVVGATIDYPSSISETSL